VGPTYQLIAERGKGGLRRGRFPAMEAEIERRIDAARGLLGQARKVATREGVG
jgi:hypothetical protein